MFRDIPTKTGRERAPKGSENAANRALRQLFDGGWVDRIPLYVPDVRNYRDGREALANVLTRKGGDALQEHYDEVGEGQVVRWSHARNPDPWREQFHTGAIANVGIIAMKACQPDPWMLWGWEEDRYLAARQRRDQYHFVTIPDAFFVIANQETGRDYAHFLEIDLGTETHFSVKDRTTWSGKIAGYSQYIPTHYDSDFEGLPRPVVLTLTRGEKRLENLLETTRQEQGGGAYWFASLSDLHRFGFWSGIWRVPHEPGYRSLLDRCTR